MEAKLLIFILLCIIDPYLSSESCALGISVEVVVVVGFPGYKNKCLLLWELEVSVVTPAT